MKRMLKGKPLLTCVVCLLVCAFLGGCTKGSSDDMVRTISRTCGDAIAFLSKTDYLAELGDPYIFSFRIVDETNADVLRTTIPAANTILVKMKVEKGGYTGPYQLKYSYCEGGEWPYTVVVCTEPISGEDATSTVTYATAFTSITARGDISIDSAYSDISTYLSVPGLTTLTIASDNLAANLFAAGPQALSQCETLTSVRLEVSPSLTADAEAFRDAAATACPELAVSISRTPLRTSSSVQETTAPPIPPIPSSQPAV